ncbi:MAG TPA: hypothetical protein VFA02_12875 [Pseudacidobacterium sp.]|nr:hypothetical protein [Pseudacidobacterium sp.]
MCPTTEWNYAFDIHPENAEGSITTIAARASQSSFTKDGAPVKLEVKARQLPSWMAVDNVANPAPQGPVRSAEPEKQITLVPYAAAKLRVTAFPELERSNSQS